jgi:hypothetical protein
LLCLLQLFQGIYTAFIYGQGTFGNTPRSYSQSPFSRIIDASDP